MITARGAWSWIAFAVLTAGAAASWASFVAEETLEGKVIAIADGDTLTLLDKDKGQHKVRLEGIDAPESHQDFGTKAKQGLSDKVFGAWVKCRVVGQDKYGRTLGHIYVRDRWINQEMVEDGLAWHYVKYSSDKQLAAAEKEARKAKCGLWKQDNPVAPWDFRNPKYEAGSNPSIVYVTKSGSKYHRGNCRHLVKSRIAISVVEAKKRYEPCKACKP